MHVSTARFHYDKLDQMFSADISDLGKGFDFDRIYPDACDAGLILVSHKTGKAIPFYVSETRYNDEGEVMFWRLQADSRDPRIRNITMVLFND